MPVVDFAATADLLGHRTRVRWTRLPESGESVLSEAPPITVRGKDLDFEYLDLPDGGVLFESAAFPGVASATRTIDVAELPVEHRDERRVDVDVTTISERSVAPVALAHPDLTQRADTWTETTRVTRRVVRNETGAPVAEHFELLDAGRAGQGLRSQIPRCYQLTIEDADTGPLQAVTVPTHGYGMSRVLYDMVPTIWRKEDDAPLGVGPSTGRVGVVPESRIDAGPLRRFVDLFGNASDHLRSRAEGLATLHDVENVRPDMLHHLAHLVGWNLTHGQPIPEQRHQIRFAARLYSLTGTVPGVELWAKRLTNWEVEVHEYAENVLWTNDPGGETSITRSGSMTVDTADTELVASLHQADDRGDFTYDTRSTPDARYSPHTIGLFPSFDEGDTAATVDRNVERLFSGVDQFLPANLRMIVVLPEPEPSETSAVALGATADLDTLETPS